MRLSLLGLVATTALAAQPLEVHEWGTFTSVAGTNGAPVRWRVEGTDLPSFVYPHGAEDDCSGLRACLRVPGGKGAFSAFVRMETPVLYFYTPVPRTLSVKVSFPRGVMTEWYPAVKETSPVGQRSTLDWGTITVDPRATPTLPAEAVKNHYYAAREVDAAPVRVEVERYGLDGPGCADVTFASGQRTTRRCVTTERSSEWERFLFYRGVGDFEPPVSATLVGNRVALEVARPLGQALLFERRGDRVGFRRVDLRARVAVERPRLDGSMTDVHRALEQALIGTGLFEKEARAMLATWDDAWFVEGVRLFYLVPQAQTEVLLPLTISPAPDRVVRTIVGRLDLLTPEQVGAMKRSLEAFAADDDNPYPRLKVLTAEHGRFTLVLLTRAFATSPELAARLPSLNRYAEASASTARLE